MKPAEAIKLLLSMNLDKDLVFACGQAGVDPVLHIEEGDEEIIISGSQHWKPRHYLHFKKEEK